MIPEAIRAGRSGRNPRTPRLTQSDGVPLTANRRSESSGRDYVSLSLAAPEFGPRRLYANLGQAAGGPEDRFAVIWNPAD